MDTDEKKHSAWSLATLAVPEHCETCVAIEIALVFLGEEKIKLDWHVDEQEAIGSM